MLAIDGIQVDIAGTAVLREVSCRFERGRTYGIVGRNGAGKTTLMRVLMGVLPARGGVIEFDGAEITRVPASRRLHLGFGYMPEDRRLIPNLSVEENVLMPLTSLGKKDAARLEWVYSLIPEVKELRSRMPSLLSGGQQKLVALSRALVAGTRVLLLDEPTEGVAPLLQVRIHNILREIGGGDRLVLVSESNPSYLADLAHHVYFIERGRITPHRRAPS
jgi:branched-chain amino acid transport system ATP-binding protein